MNKSLRSSIASITYKNLGIRFKKASLLEAALFHPTYRNENPLPPMEDFDRLEFFGDAILNFMICKKIYQLFPTDDEGMLSRIRSILVSRKILARIAQTLGFLKMIRIGKCLKHQDKLSRMKTLADSFEAFLGALYLDQGLAKTERFILLHFEPYLSIKRLFRLDPNPKSILQEICQRHLRRLPAYSHAMTPSGVEVEIIAAENQKVRVVAKSRREAEEKAARLLVRKLRQDFLAPSAKRVSSGKKLRNTC